MAQSNWSGFGRRNERPIMNLRQTEGERLHDQALSFYAHGNLGQAKLLLEKAIALEPSNESFQETRNSFSRISQWSSHGHHHQDPGHSFPDAEPQWSQFRRNPPVPVNSSRQHWDSGGVHSGSNFSNGNVYKPRNARAQWNGNSNQYFSDSVADSMFGPAYWEPQEGVQNHGVNSHFGEPRPPQRQNNAPYAGRTNFGSHYGKASNAHMQHNNMQDNVWGQWNSPGADADPKPETSWVDSGYKQSDVPWTDEPRKASSLPNCTRSGTNGSIGQSSLRGSMANSTERFSLKEHRGRAGQSSPNTWRSEETSSETNYGLDNFDEVSHKVQEWLVRNESSGVQNPPSSGLGKPKNKKKKKKKKMETTPKHESQATVPKEETKKDASQGERLQTVSINAQLPSGGSQNPVRNRFAGVESHKNENKSPSVSVPYHNQATNPRTGSSPGKPATNSNFDKVSKQSNPNPNGSKVSAGSQLFFDPKRIFDSSKTSAAARPSWHSNQKDSSAKANPTKKSETEDSVYSRKLSSNESRKGHSATATGEKQRVSADVKIAEKVDLNSSQENETESMTEDTDRSRLNSSGSVGSDVSGRMTREEWEEIINRMYEPLGIPSNISQETLETADGISSDEETKTPAKQTFSIPNCSENVATASDSDTFRGIPVSEWEAAPDSVTGSRKWEPHNRSTYAAKRASRYPLNDAVTKQYLDVKPSLQVGLLENSIPVCHAGTGIRLTAPTDKRIRFFGKDKCLSTESTQSTQAIPSSQKPVSKAPSVASKAEKTSSEVCNNLPAKPVHEPKVENNAAPSEKSSNVASRRLQVSPSKGSRKGSPKHAKEPRVQVSSAPFLTSSKSADGGMGVNPRTSEKKSEWEAPGKTQPKQPSKVEAASLKSRNATDGGTGNQAKHPETPAKKNEREISAKVQQTQPSRVEVSSTASPKSSNGAGEGIADKARHPEPCGKKSERKAPAKVQPKQPSKVDVTSSTSQKPSTTATDVGNSVKVKQPDASDKKIQREAKIQPTQRSKEEVSSETSTKSSRAADGGIRAQAKRSETSDKKSEQETPAKMQTTEPSKAFWEPSRIFAAPPKKNQESRIRESAVESSKKAGNVTPPVQQTAHSQKNTCRQENKDAVKASDFNSASNECAKSGTVTAEAPAAKRASTSKTNCKSDNDSLNSASIGQTDDAPMPSSTKYSYVAWRDHNAEKDKDTSKKTSQASSTKASESRSFASTESKRSAQPEAQPAPKPAARPTKVGTSQNRSEDPTWRPDTASSKVHFGNNSSQEDFSTTRTNSTNKEPSAKPNTKAKETSKPHPRESKTRSGAAPNSHQYQQRRAETSYASSSHPGRPSTYSSSKASRSGTTQGSSQQTSSRTSGAGARTAASAEDTYPQQKQRPGATTDNLDIEDVDPWYKWTRAIGRGLWWTLCFIVFLLLILLACLFSTLKVGLKYSWHILRELVSLLQENRQGGRSHERSSESQGSWGSSGNGHRRQPAEPTRSIDIPTSGGEAIRRLMRCNQDNPYEVLGVSSEASEDDMKRYYRRQCMLVHPDKNDHPNAREAFQILQKAYETLTDPVKRRNFEMESENTHFNEKMEDFVKKMEERMEEVLNTLPCDVCHGKHRRYETNRDFYYARYCARHGTRHLADEGDVWVETSHLGFKWHFYAMMDDKIYDITEWARCQDMKYMEPNSCDIRYRVGTKRNKNTPRQRTSSPNHHSHHRSQDFNNDLDEELLKEFLRQFQQGEPRGGGAAGAGYGGGDSYSQDRGRKQKKHRKKKR